MAAKAAAKSRERVCAHPFSAHVHFDGGGPSSGKRKAGTPNPVLKAQGSTRKRTPQSNFDAAAGKDVYEPEKVVAERLSRGDMQFPVNWVGWESKSNTSEPINHLTSCEDMLAEFKERQKHKNAEPEPVAEQKKIEKQEAAAAAAAAAATESAAARLDFQAAAAAAQFPPGPVGEVASTPRPDSAQVSLPVKAMQRRTAACREVFDDAGCELGYTACKCMLTTGEVCGVIICTKTGPASMWNNHLMHMHKNEYVRLKPPSVPLNIGAIKKEYTQPSVPPAR